MEQKQTLNVFKEAYMPMNEGTNVNKLKKKYPNATDKQLIAIDINGGVSDLGPYTEASVFMTTNIVTIFPLTSLNGPPSSNN